jgi:hypothetical protein
MGKGLSLQLLHLSPEEPLGFDIKPEHYGKPAAFVERKGSVFKVYTLEQVAPCQTQKKV